MALTLEGGFFIVSSWLYSRSHGFWFGWLTLFTRRSMDIRRNHSEVKHGASGGRSTQHRGPFIITLASFAPNRSQKTPAPVLIEESIAATTGARPTTTRVSGPVETFFSFVRTTSAPQALSGGHYEILLSSQGPFYFPFAVSFCHHTPNPLVLARLACVLALASLIPRTLTGSTPGSLPTPVPRGNECRLCSLTF